ncbi:MAG: Asp-tRNA(Asn)/Glu-tRNA(Gln) amidotransferase subunit GatC [Pseudomonadota bacterium]
MHIEEDYLKQLGVLARIQLSGSDLAALSKQLKTIIDLVDQISSVPTDHIEPMAHPVPDQFQRRRPDVVTESDDHERLLALASRHEADLYLVPEVIQES